MAEILVFHVKKKARVEVLVVRCEATYESAAPVAERRTSHGTRLNSTVTQYVSAVTELQPMDMR